jgi:hypothetical protein
LTVPFGVALGAQLAISDSTVFVSAVGATYVFQEPAGGWTGTLSPSATLDSSGDVSASDASALVDGRLFTQPPAGWSGTVAPAGQVSPAATAPSGPLSPSRELLSGGFVISAFLHDPDGGCDGAHLCTVVFRALSEPAAGWSGMLRGQRVAAFDGTDAGLSAIALAGRDLVAANGNELAVLPLPAAAGFTAPLALPAHAAGLGGSTPALSFGLRSGTGQPPVQRITVTLPHGLAFSTRPGALARGVVMRGASPRRSISAGVLTLAHPSTAREIRVSIGHGALTVSRALRRRLRAGGHPSLRLTVHATTAHGTWTLTLPLTA